MERKDFSTFSHFDERAAAFFSLGQNKHAIAQNDTPALSAVITTSGTAVMNCYPALAEAYECEIPFLLISADRPIQMHGKRANQTTAQNDIFSKHTLKSLQIDLSKKVSMPERLLKRVAAALSDLRGPIHINLHLEEPSLKIDKTALSHNSENEKLSQIITATKKLSLPNPFFRQSNSKKQSKEWSLFEKTLDKYVKHLQKHRPSLISAFQKVCDPQSNSHTPLPQNLPPQVLSKNTSKKDNIDLSSPTYQSLLPVPPQNLLFGLIIVGSSTLAESLQIKRCLQHFSLPIVIDVGSPLKNQMSSNPLVFLQHEAWIEKIDCKLTFLFHFGGTFVSKKLFEYLEKHPPKNAFHFESPMRTKKIGFRNFSPISIAATYDQIEKEINFFFNKKVNPLKKGEGIYKNIAALQPKNLLEGKKENPNKTKGIYEATEKKTQSKKTVIRQLPWSELKFVDMYFSHDRKKNVAEKNKTLQRADTLFLGNSMPIRIADLLETNGKFMHIFSNRGISGIDGLIATFLGIISSQEKSKPSSQLSRYDLLIGDLSSLHDLSSFLMTKKLFDKKTLQSKKLAINFLILNNQEGGIFRNLKSLDPLTNSNKNNDYLYCHGWNFSQIAKMSSLDYFVVEKEEDTKGAFEELTKIGIRIIEAVFDGKKSSFVYRKYIKQIAG